MKDEHLRVKNKPKKLSVIKKVKKQLDKLDKAYTSQTTPLYKSLAAKLKNTWKEYKAGNIKGTVPHAWEKSGINTISSNLKNINKKK